MIAFLYRQLNSKYEEDRCLKVIIGAAIKRRKNQNRLSQRCPPLQIRMLENQRSSSPERNSNRSPSRRSVSKQPILNSCDHQFRTFVLAFVKGLLPQTQKQSYENHRCIDADLRCDNGGRMLFRTQPTTATNGTDDRREFTTAQ